MLVSQAEAAKKLGVRKERISQLVKDGKIQLVETGGRPKISVDQIERLAASGDLAPKRRGRPRKKPVGSNLGSILDWRPMVN
ncbi:hypothetical protein AKJ08_1161 [Vulgatibacter incomptus]|uniref:Helix-turn-helix domain-containing protein n=1 Tax=Vulgatibacter incomptus TaxID=1391653 RepID=A0A0K1PCE1_9BACT|nr:hypothetical protein AKJ08_1161 [Vulgatibacter incomptus]